jgi:hypothetical protein
MRAIIFIVCIGGSGVAFGQAPPADPQPASSVTSTEPARDNAWMIGVEPRLGALIPTSKLKPNVVGGLELDVVTPALDHRLVVGVDVSIAEPSYTATAMSTQLPSPGLLDYTVKQLEVVVGLTANYRFAAIGSLVPRIGVGPLLHLLKSTETTSPSYSGANTAEQTKLGVEATAGVDYKAGPGFLAGDLRFLYSGLTTPLTGGSNAGSLAIAVGYRFVF